MRPNSCGADFVLHFLPQCMRQTFVLQLILQWRCSRCICLLQWGAAACHDQVNSASQLLQSVLQAAMTDAIQVYKGDSEDVPGDLQAWHPGGCAVASIKRRRSSAGAGCCCCVPDGDCGCSAGSCCAAASTRPTRVQLTQAGVQPAAACSPAQPAEAPLAAPAVRKQRPYPHSCNNLL